MGERAKSGDERWEAGRGESRWAMRRPQSGPGRKVGVGTWGVGQRLANDARTGFGIWAATANGPRAGFGSGARVNEMLGGEGQIDVGAAHLCASSFASALREGHVSIVIDVVLKTQTETRAR